MFKKINGVLPKLNRVRSIGAAAGETAAAAAAAADDDDDDDDDDCTTHLRFLSSFNQNFTIHLLTGLLSLQLASVTPQKQFSSPSPTPP